MYPNSLTILFLLSYLQVKSANKCIQNIFSHLSSVTLCTHLPNIYKIELGVGADACILEAEARGIHSEFQASLEIV